MTEHVLVVDDDSQLTAFLERFFRKHGYRATIANTAKRVFAELQKHRFDLIILDLNLPDDDGLDVTREIRKSSAVPIIMLTARDEVFDKIIGLEIGADDYMTKPYEPRELLARVRSVLRRRVGLAASPARDTAAARWLRFENIELDILKSKAKRISDGLDLGLTSTEFALAKALADAAGDVLTRDRIMDLIYGNSLTATDRAIDAHIARLRRKLMSGDETSSVILTVHGSGYKLAATTTKIA
ncbi:MAG: response regulator transcription factor [Rhodobacteraceae bacterium]|nr:response regulator transcription factor [Paracoccaceae bacterium]